MADFLLFKLATIDAWVNEIMWVVNPVNAPLNTWPSIQFNEPLKNKEKWTLSRIYSSPKQPSARHSNKMHLERRGCEATLIWPMLHTFRNTASQCILDISNLMEQPDNIEITQSGPEFKKKWAPKETDMFECMLMSKFIEFMRFTKRQISIYRV